MIIWRKTAGNIKKDDYGGIVTIPEGRIVMSLVNGQEYVITIYTVNKFVLTQRTNLLTSMEFIGESEYFYEFLRMLETSWQRGSTYLNGAYFRTDYPKKAKI